MKAGEWITAMGGWTPAQFAENRLPTLAELDAAAPSNPVLVFNSFTGPAATNTLGKNFFIAKGVAVDSGDRQYCCRMALDRRLERTARHSDLRRQEAGNTRRHGLFGQRRRDHKCRHGRLHHSECSQYPMDSAKFDTLASWDPFTAYDPLLALYDEGKVSVRVRIFFLSMDRYERSDDHPARAQRVQ